MSYEDSDNYEEVKMVSSNNENNNNYYVVVSNPKSDDEAKENFRRTSQQWNWKIILNPKAVQAWILYDN